LLFYERSFKSIVYAAIIAGFINAFLPVLFTLEKWKLNFSYLNKDLINKLLQFGLPLVPATALTWILNSFDKIGLKQWSSYEQLGLYAAAFKVAALLGVLQTIFTTAWVPVAYQWYENNEDIKKFDKVNTCVLTVFSFAFSLIVIFRDIIILFLGPDYRNISLTMIYLLFVPFMYTLGTAAIGIDLTKKTIYNLVAIFICTLFNIAGNYVLIPVLGAQGAALSTAFSYTLWFFVRFCFARKLWYKFSMKNYIIDLLLILLLLQCVQFNAPRFIEIIVVIVIFIINLFMIRKKVDISLLIPGRIK
jgi:O-antigen/teichoic acid export membrane protein